MMLETKSKLMGYVLILAALVLALASKGETKVAIVAGILALLAIIAFGVSYVEFVIGNRPAGTLIRENPDGIPIGYEDIDATIIR